VNELKLPELFATAAQVAINERCAPAYLHDIRGSMQALLSAFELLGRSARLGGDNALRVEKACDLARRAIIHHEKSTMEVLQLLTLQHAEAAAVDVGALVHDVVHFLRNEAATKEVIVMVTTVTDLNISTERAKLRTLLIGLLTAAIDCTPAGSELRVTVERRADEALVSIGSDAGYVANMKIEELLSNQEGHLSSQELTMLFATQFLTSHLGRLEIDSRAEPRGALNLYYPCSVG
jgi:signal transduction histidine kinase